MILLWSFLVFRIFCLPYLFLVDRRNNCLCFITRFIHLLKSYLFVEMNPFSYQIHLSASLLSCFTLNQLPLYLLPSQYPRGSFNALLNFGHYFLNSISSSILIFIFIFLKHMLKLIFFQKRRQMLISFSMTYRLINWLGIDFYVPSHFLLAF